MSGEGVQHGLPALFLIRHGETAWSLSGQHTGRTDIALTAQGENMARELANLLDPVPFSAIWTSPRQRAQRTCALATGGRPATIEADLAEWDYGNYEGMLTADIRKTVPGWSIFRDGCPGGETIDDVVMRVDRLIARLRSQPGNIALFSHGHFGCVLAARWLGMAGREGEHFTLDPASLSILGPRPGHPEIAVIRRWNIVPSARLGLSGA